MLHSKAIWPSFLRFWWLGIKLTIWFLAFFKAIMFNSQFQMENVNSFSISTFQELFQWYIEAQFWPCLLLHFCSKDFKLHGILVCKLGKPFGNVRIHFLTFVEVGLRHKTLQALILVVSPRLRLHHYGNLNSWNGKLVN
jgi:hypothetical protein